MFISSYAVSLVLLHLQQILLLLVLSPHFPLCIISNE